VTSLSGPKMTSLSGVYMSDSHKVYYGIYFISNQIIGLDKNSGKLHELSRR
jgi:hypothetical protein